MPSPGPSSSSSARVVAEQGVGAAGEFEVMGRVGLGFGGLHAGHRVAQRDPLIEGGEGPELDPSA